MKPKTLKEVTKRYQDAEEMARHSIRDTVLFRLPDIEQILSEGLYWKQPALEMKVKVTRQLLYIISKMFSQSECPHCIYDVLLGSELNEEGLLAIEECHACVWRTVHSKCSDDGSLYSRLRDAISDLESETAHYELGMTGARFKLLRKLTNEEIKRAGKDKEGIQ